MTIKFQTDDCLEQPHEQASLHHGPGPGHHIVTRHHLRPAGRDGVSGTATLQPVLSQARLGGARRQGNLGLASGGADRSAGQVAAGCSKEFGSIVEENLASYGDEWKGVKLDDAQDGFYNPEKAKAEFAKAKEALQAEGVEFPIHLDIPVSSADTNGIKSVQSLKQSIEANLGSDNVVIDIQQMTDDELNNITYFATSASQEDWDLNNNLGWSPDYNDPSSYLEITGSKTGENVDSYFGFDPGTDNAAAKEAGFEEYDKLLEDAASENEDINKRYEK